MADSWPKQNHSACVAVDSIADMNGYDAVMRAADEAPELISSIRACFEYPSATFKKKWVEPGTYGTFRRLVDLSVLERVEPGGADANALYRFADPEGAGRALAELSAPAQNR